MSTQSPRRHISAPLLPPTQCTRPVSHLDAAMAAPGPINLYANNQPTTPNLPAHASNSILACLQQTRQLHDTSPTQQWTQALQPLADSTAQTGPHHRSSHGDRLQIRTRPLCYRNAAYRNNCFRHGGLSQAQQAVEASHSDLISDWNNAYRATTGWGGLVCSPTGAASFNTSGARWVAFQNVARLQGLLPDSPAYNALYRQHVDMWVNAGGYYESWHCCAVFIANTRIFIYDPHFDSATSPWADPSRLRRLGTDLQGISMVRHLIQWARPSDGRRISIHPDRIYIYRNNDTLQQRNAAGHVPMAVAPGADCVPLSIQWLAGIAEAWQHDPQEWLECAVDDSTQHGAIPMPRNPTSAALSTATAAHFDAADWERIRA